MNRSKWNQLFWRLGKSKGFLSQTTLSLLLLVGLFTITKNANLLFDNLKNTFSYQVTQPQINDPHLIIQQMNAVSELTTSEFVIDTIVPTSSTRQLGNLVLGETKLLYVARGEVKAGLDLSKMTSDDINIDGEMIMIKLPSPEILDSKIDLNHSQVYDYNRGFLNLGPDVALQLQSQAQLYTLAQIKQTACQQDILAQANDKAITLIRQLMTNAGYTEVKVIAQNSTDCI